MPWAAAYLRYMQWYYTACCNAASLLHVHTTCSGQCRSFSSAAKCMAKDHGKHLCFTAWRCCCTKRVCFTAPGWHAPQVATCCWYRSKSRPMQSNTVLLPDACKLNAWCAHKKLDMASTVSMCVSTCTTKPLIMQQASCSLD